MVSTRRRTRAAHPVADSSELRGSRTGNRKGAVAATGQVSMVPACAARRANRPQCRIDVLEKERANGRISAGAFRTGRHIQAVFERSTLSVRSPWPGHERAGFSSAEDRALRKIEDAAQLKAVREQIAVALGVIDTKLVEQVLLEGLGFANVAALQGRSGEREIAYIAQRFRDALELLSRSDLDLASGG